jgi:hypothetical protein
LIQSGITLAHSGAPFPPLYAAKIGVYKLIVRDATGRVGMTTIAVKSGPLKQVTFAPLSSMIQKEAQTLGIISLQDALGNPITPDFHTIDITTQGGYIIDANGEKKTSMHMSSMDAKIPLILGADTAGTLDISIMVDGGLKTVFDQARMILSIPNSLRVGDAPQTLSFRILDEKNAPLKGFASVASLSLPDGAGGFDPTVILIKDGISESFSYIPGTIA